MNSHNPFTPPSTDFSAPSAQTETTRKPRSVWVVQIVGGLIAASNTLGLAMLAFNPGPIQSDSSFGIPVWFLLCLQSCFVLVLLFMLWELPKRSRIGRILGLAMMAFFACASVFSDHGQNSPSAFYTAGRWMATAVVVSILAYWAYAFGFSEKARSYFSLVRHD